MILFDLDFISLIYLMDSIILILVIVFIIIYVILFESIAEAVLKRFNITIIREHHWWARATGISKLYFPENISNLNRSLIYICTALLFLVFLIGGILLIAAVGGSLLHS